MVDAGVKDLDFENSKKFVSAYLKDHFQIQWNEEGFDLFVVYRPTLSLIE